MQTADSTILNRQTVLGKGKVQLELLDFFNHIYRFVYMYSKPIVARRRNLYHFQGHLGKFRRPTESAILHLIFTFHYFHMI